ncbi:hypothetical protein [Spiroplasma endosymbiont of Nebria brevicollis]
MQEKIHIWIEKELKEQIQKYCSANETTLSQLTRKLLKEFLKNEQ